MQVVACLVLCLLLLLLGCVVSIVAASLVSISLLQHAVFRHDSLLPVRFRWRIAPQSYVLAVVASSCCGTGKTRTRCRMMMMIIATV